MMRALFLLGIPGLVAGTGSAAAQPVTREQAMRAAIHPVGDARTIQAWLSRVRVPRTFPDDFAGPRNDGQSAPADSLAELERRHILGVLKEANGNREEAARRLGISRKTIDRKCALWDV